MNYVVFKRIVVLVSAALLVVTPGLHAQDMVFDFEPPEIVHQDQHSAVAGGEPRIISATVTDNVGVRQVVLNYRTKGERRYMQQDMSAGSSAVLYMATVPERDAIEPGIEYYIEATDESGNTSTKGFAVAPLFLSITEAQTVVANGNQNEPQSTISSKNWIWIGLGAAVLGGLALSSGGGSGGGGGGGEDVPISVTVSPP